MNSAVLALVGLICFGLGYKYYSRFIEKNIYGLNQNDTVNFSCCVFSNVDCFRSHNMEIYTSRVGIMAHFWSQQSNVSCFDSFNYLPIFFSGKKTHITLIDSFWIYNNYNIADLIFESRILLSKQHNFVYH